MCGIFGVLKKLKHRGPDFLSSCSLQPNLMLGHARLSIIDLSDQSNQPFSIDDGDFTIVFNGEIYNYLELKLELQNLGIKFNTDGDTEVLLQAYKIFGVNCLSKFNGMWSFTIFDKKKDFLFCSRDRFGVKPFVYTYKDNEFIFSSEAKAILEYKDGLNEPNYTQIANYIRSTLGAQTTDTWFKDIHRLLGGHYMIVDKNGLRIEQYFQYPTSKSYISFEDACIQFKEIFTDAVKIRMRSDVPVGTTLSSGVDSSAIVSVLRSFHQDRHQTYTAYFDNNKASCAYYNNLTEIKEELIVKKLENDLNLDSHYIKIEDVDYIKDLKNIIYHLESGHGSPAIFPIDKVFSCAHGKNKVILEGQGADELLGGYINNNIVDIVIRNFIGLKFKTAYNNLIRFRQYYKLRYAIILYIRQSFPEFLLKFYYNKGSFERILNGPLKNQKVILHSNRIIPKGYTLLKKKLFRSHSDGLVDLLHYGDILSMKYGIEGRQPFLDYRLVDFVFTLPEEYLVHNGEGKMLLKKALDGIIPNYVLTNIHKVGFATPIEQLFYKHNPRNVLDYFDKEICKEIFDISEMNKLIEEHNTGKDHSRLLFRLLSTIIWFKVFIKE
jgi:asparagine synthase (glutamine-hydrolysing)